MHTGELRLRVVEYYLFWFAHFGAHMPRGGPDGGDWAGQGFGSYGGVGGGLSRPLMTPGPAATGSSPFAQHGRGFLERGLELTQKVLHHQGGPGGRRGPVRPFLALFTRYLEFFCGPRAALSRQEAEAFLGIAIDYWLVDTDGSGQIGGASSSFATVSYGRNGDYGWAPPAADLADSLAALVEHVAREAVGASTSDARGGAAAALAEGHGGRGGRSGAREGGLLQRRVASGPGCLWPSPR